MNPKSLAKRLKELRVIRGMSQEFLAEESRVGLRTIQRIENEESEPTGETIKRLATALGVEINELVGSKLLNEINDLNSTLIFFKRKLSKTSEKSEIRNLNKFISLLTNLKNKDLTQEQVSAIENYIQYLELEKIPSFSNDLFKQKLSKFKKHLKTNLGFVPNNQYKNIAIYFSIPFVIGFVSNYKIDLSIKIGIALAAITLITIGVILDFRIKKMGRTLRF